MKSPSKPDISRSPNGAHRFIASRTLVIVALGWLAISAGLGIKTAVNNQPERRPPNDSRASAMSFATVPGSTAVIRTQSCSTSNCHGSLTGDPSDLAIRSDEYHVWMDDPHAKASLTLLGTKSQEMFERLGLKITLPPGNGASEAAKKHWKNCQGCHDTNQHLSDSVPVAERDNYVSEGVSCESCHGDSREWLNLHVHDGWSKKISVDEKRRLQLVTAEDLPSRVKQCASCHVGGGTADVNHDLIAAGHPALKFEYTWYLSRLPKHWKPSRIENASNRSSEWLIGQLVTAIAALEQLENRANSCVSMNAKTLQSSWPELAEYNCFACHHDLNERSWRQKRGFSGLDLTRAEQGRLAMPWGNWNLELTEVLADTLISAESKEFSSAFHRLVQMLQATELAGAAETSTQSRIVREKLQLWLKSCQSENLDTDRILHELVLNQHEKLVSSWDKTASIMLGIASSYRNSRLLSDKLKAAMDQIRFPSEPTTLDSPRDFRSEQVPNAKTGEDWANLLKSLVEFLHAP
jgi:Cytochrome c554 and c-prime